MHRLFPPPHEPALAPDPRPPATHLVVWTPAGLRSLPLDPAAARRTGAVPLPTPDLLRAPLDGARRLSCGHVAAMVGNGPPVSPFLEAAVGRLVVLRPEDPAAAVDLGPATHWFPAYDGAGVWRVREEVAAAYDLGRHSRFEAVPFGTDGQARGPELVLTEGRRPVAALRDALVVEEPAPPGRPYPPDVVGTMRTLAYAVTTDLVACDPVTGRPGARLGDYTRVGLAGAGGIARVGGSDVNVPMRATEVIDLSTGQPVAAAPPELALTVTTAPPREPRAAARTIRTNLEPRPVLAVASLNRTLTEYPTDRLPGPPAPGLAARDAAVAWAGDLLAFVEDAPGGSGVRAGVWNARTRRTVVLEADLPSGAVPFAAHGHTWSRGTVTSQVRT